MTDGQTGKSVAGATLDVGPGASAAGTSDSNGQVSAIFMAVNTLHQVKASKPGSIRSNRVTLIVRFL